MSYCFKIGAKGDSQMNDSLERGFVVRGFRITKRCQLNWKGPPGEVEDGDSNSWGG